LSIKGYLEKVGMVLTNSEKDFDEHAITGDKVATLLKSLASPLSIFSSTAGIAAELSAKIVPSISELLEKKRYSAAMLARQSLEEILRKEFGVWIIEEKNLANAMLEDKKEYTEVIDGRHLADDAVSS
jgi:hypothetical protein